MDAIKKRILELWHQVNRPGIEDLIKFLQESDFFIAPCSTNHHLACPGGLARHSLNVYGVLHGKIDLFSDRNCNLSIFEESVIVTALGHDLCKVNFYKEGRTLQRGPA